MDKFILELPDLLSPQVCNIIRNRFDVDENRETGHRNYTLNKRNITRKKNATDLYMRSEYGRWADVFKLIEENTQLIIEKYKKHLNKNFNRNENGERHVFEREMAQKDLECSHIIIEKYEKGAKNQWTHRYDIYDTDFLDIIWFINTLEGDENASVEFINGQRFTPECGKVIIYPSHWTLPMRINPSNESAMYMITRKIRFNL